MISHIKVGMYVSVALHHHFNSIQRKKGDIINAKKMINRVI